jgi:hypothetical protein
VQVSLLFEWNYGAADRGHVLGDDEGHAKSVVCASGYGIEESGAEYAVEEVVFCPGTQQTVRESCGESEFPKVLALLETRKVPDGMYYLPEAAKKAVPSPPDWTVIHEEAGGLRLMRYTNGAMAWVSSDGASIVEGLDAQALDVEYSFLFSDAEKKRLEEKLVTGADGMAAMRELFGNDLAGLSLLSEVTVASCDWTRRHWRVEGGGVLYLMVTETGAIDSFYPIEKGDAYIWVAGLSRE